MVMLSDVQFKSQRDHGGAEIFINNDLCVTVKSIYSFSIHWHMFIH